MGNTKEPFTLKWNIENFNFLPLKRGEMLKSPAFNLGISEPLYLEFYPRGDILESDGESIVVCVSQKHLNDYRVSDLFLNMTDSGLKVWNFERVARQYDRLKWVFKPERKVMAETAKYKLIVTCTFTPVAEPSHINAEDMEALSKDLKDLYQNGQFSDLLLICQGHSFNVHECILSSRIPAILNDLLPVQNPDHPNVKEVDLDVDTLKFLLHYVYTGQFLYASKIPDGVYKVAESYRMNDLKQSLYFLPQSLVADTCVKIDYIQLQWAIGPELMKIHTTKEVVSPAIPCNLLFKSNFRVVCRYDESVGLNPVRVSIRRIGLGNLGSPLFLKLQIQVTGPFSCSIRIADLTFNCDEEKEFPLLIERWTDSFLMTCHFYMSIGESSSLVRTESKYSDCDQTFLKSRHLNTFCSDIGRLYNIFLPKKSDVSLHVGDVQFPVHKAVLSARSRVFSKMFETDMVEKKSGIVKISDIEVEKVNMMLCYLYNGKVSITNCALAMDLYSVADKYELISLKERCFSFLKESFGNSDCNPSELYVFADVHSDENLKTLAKNYIRDNCKTVLKTDNFKNFIFSRPDLATEVLQEISNNLQSIAIS